MASAVSSGPGHWLSVLAQRLRSAEARALPASVLQQEGGWDLAAQERLCRAFQAENLEAVQARAS